MPFADHDDVVQAFTSNRADPPPAYALPYTAGGAPGPSDVLKPPSPERSGHPGPGLKCATRRFHYQDPEEVRLNRRARLVPTRGREPSMLLLDASDHTRLRPTSPWGCAWCGALGWARD
jgi:hypothetical protein